MKTESGITFQFFTLAIFISVAVLIKSILITAPFAGHFASYQVVMAMIAENFRVDHFAHILYPKLFSIHNGAPALELIYYPWCSLIAALGSFVFGGSLEFWGRFQSIIFSSLTAIPLFSIAKKMSNVRVALISAVLFLLSPLMLVYGRSFQNESVCIFLLVLTVDLLLTNQLNWKKVFIAGLLFSIALVGRFNYIVFLPLIFWILYEQIGVRRGMIHSFLFGFVALSLSVLWLWHSYKVSEVNPHVHSNVFVQVMSGKGFPHPLLLDPKYYLKVMDILIDRTVTPLGIVLIPFGLFCLKEKKQMFLIFWALLALSVIILIPVKVFDHGFYLIPFVPPAAIFAAMGVEKVWVLIQPGKRGILIHCGVIAFIFLWLAFVARFFVPAAFFVPASSYNIVKVGQWVNKNTLPSEWIIAAYDTPSELLYYSHRNGWGFLMAEKNRTISSYWKIKALSHMTDDEMKEREEQFSDPITWLERLKREGAKYLIAPNKKQFISNPNFAAYVEKNFPMISKQEDDFVAFDLKIKKISS